MYALRRVAWRVFVMSTSPSDGGPAFPDGAYTNTGMSLRDYFAGKALAAMSCSYMDQHATRDPQAMFTGAARNAYRYADAMLVERERKRDHA
jgi:hypothetical protein